VGAVKPSLVAELTEHESPAGRDGPEGERSYFTLSYDFTLAQRAE
ncbi:MAG: hypothetical protein HY704_13045, partial [Gemmatimonadetes bacterium]|nr:hypothetical protein [Gemmatimonadota bacterium]